MEELGTVSTFIKKWRGKVYFILSIPNEEKEIDLGFGKDFNERWSNSEYADRQVVDWWFENKPTSEGKFDIYGQSYITIVIV